MSPEPPVAKKVRVGQAVDAPSSSATAATGTNTCCPPVSCSTDGQATRQLEQTTPPNAVDNIPPSAASLDAPFSVDELAAHVFHAGKLRPRKTGKILRFISRHCMESRHFHGTHAFEPSSLYAFVSSICPPSHTYFNFSESLLHPNSRQRMQS